MKHRRAFQTWTGSEDGKPKVPLLSLRIFAENNPRRFFAEVYVWEFLYQVRALKLRHARHTLAFWHEFQEPEKKVYPDKLGRPIISRKLGEMHLCLPSCTYNTIAHEAYHATRTFARRSGNIEAGTFAEAAKERIWQGMPEEVNASFQGLLTDRITAAVLRLVNSREESRQRKRGHDKSVITVNLK